MTNVEVRHTPLYDAHVRAGATMTDFAGWAMPLRYGSEIAEHRSVRAAAGLFDLTHMGEIEVAGPQATDALNYALVSDVAKIRVGKARYTMICQPDGGIIDDLIIYRLAGQRYLVVANAANAEIVATALNERAAGFEAEVSDRGAEWALIAIQGPNSVAVLSGLTRTDLDAVGYYAITTGDVAGRTALLARTGYTGEDGFEIFCAPHDAEAIWSTLSATGQPHGLVLAGLSCRDTLRLEAGMPLYGHELTTQVTPFDAGLGRVVMLDKSCDFVGRDALAARSSHPDPRRLVGLATSGRRAPRSGHVVLESRSGNPVGEVTSGAPSPTLGHPIAMAYLDTALASTGTSVRVDVRGRAEEARVVDLPFYDRPR